MAHRALLVAILILVVPTPRVVAEQAGPDRRARLLSLLREAEAARDREGSQRAIVGAERARVTRLGSETDRLEEELRAGDVRHRAIETTRLPAAERELTAARDARRRAEAAVARRADEVERAAESVRLEAHELSRAEAHLEGAERGLRRAEIELRALEAAHAAAGEHDCGHELEYWRARVAGQRSTVEDERRRHRRARSSHHRVQCDLEAREQALRSARSRHHAARDRVVEAEDTRTRLRAWLADRPTVRARLVASLENLRAQRSTGAERLRAEEAALVPLEAERQILEARVAEAHERLRARAASILTGVPGFSAAFGGVDAVRLSLADAEDGLFVARLSVELLEERRWTTLDRLEALARGSYVELVEPHERRCADLRSRQTELEQALRDLAEADVAAEAEAGGHARELDELLPELEALEAELAEAREARARLPRRGVRRRTRQAVRAAVSHLEAAERAAAVASARRGALEASLSAVAERRQELASRRGDVIAQRDATLSELAEADAARDRAESWRARAASVDEGVLLAALQRVRALP